MPGIRSPLPTIDGPTLDPGEVVHTVEGGRTIALCGSRTRGLPPLPVGQPHRHCRACAEELRARGVASHVDGCAL